MGFREWVIDLLGGKARTQDGVEVNIESEIYEKVEIKEMALNSACNLIGNSIALSEFKKYVSGKEKKDNDYFALNIEPNKNYSASEFWKKWVNKLVLENEVLVVKVDDSFYIADSFTKITKAFYPNYYKNIVVENFKLDRGFQEKEVLYFRFNEKRIKSLIDGIYKEQGKLIEYAKASYRKNNAKRGTMDIPTNYPQTKEAKERLEKLLNEDIRKFYNSESGAVLPLTNGVKYTDLSSDSYKNSTDSRDIRNLMDDVFDFVAISLGIPPQLLKGNVANLEEVIDSFVKFGLGHIVEILEDEINRKLFSKEEILGNTYVKVDLTKLKTTNLTKLATTIDILTRNGVHSVDENRELIGKEPLRTEESQKRNITKNYETI